LAVFVVFVVTTTAVAPVSGLVVVADCGVTELSLAGGSGCDAARLAVPSELASAVVSESCVRELRLWEPNFGLLTRVLSETAAFCGAAGSGAASGASVLESAFVGLDDVSGESCCPVSAHATPWPVPADRAIPTATTAMPYRPDPRVLRRACAIDVPLDVAIDGVNL
jgi:hypothetical protein